MDLLTGLLNRRGLRSKLYTEIAMANRTHYIFCVALIDLDHFKSINDGLGHAAGDSALRYITKVIGSKTRIYDTLGRYGGDELLLVLPSTELNTAVIVGQNICQAVQVSSREREPQLTVSIGIAQVMEGDTTYALIVRADSALYTAKRMGRNRVEFNMEPLVAFP